MAKRKYNYIDLSTPFSTQALICVTETGLSELYFPWQEPFHHAYETSDNPFFSTIKMQLNAYLSGQLKKFTIPIDFNSGTEHQLKVWDILKNIPYGQTTSYKNIADKINSSPRAVGGAIKRNPLPIIIPCHRVIKHNGTLGGYFGQIEKHYHHQSSDNKMLHLKHTLLKLEADNLHI